MRRNRPQKLPPWVRLPLWAATSPVTSGGSTFKGLVWKVYRTLPDPKAIEVGCLRVIDESGEDYLYPADRFVQVAFPDDIRKRLLALAGRERA